MTPKIQQYPELEMKTIIRRHRCADGLGWDLLLSCGHEVWMAADPIERTYCGVCIDRFREKIVGTSRFAE